MTLPVGSSNSLRSWFPMPDPLTLVGTTHSAFIQPGEGSTALPMPVLKVEDSQGEGVEGSAEDHQRTRQS